MSYGNLTALIPWLIFGYLMGSFPTGYVLVKLIRGEDIRNAGSKNTGATNVGRVLGRKWAVLTAIVDMLKGGLAVLAATLYGVGNPIFLASIGAAGVLGHDYPVWLRFNGGKGVATTYGVIAFYGFFNPLPAFLGGVVWLSIRELTLKASVASMVSLGSATLFMLLFSFDGAYVLAGALMTALTIWRHRENIKRLISGSENTVKPLFRRAEEKGQKAL
jgi:glycerol-3-phosphate acyltransferase PlsY